MRILHLDIETAPNKVYVWSLWDQNVSINQIVEPGYTLCFAAKWHDAGKVIFEGINTTSPKAMIKRAWNLLNEADVVCNYNGKKFDIPTLNREFLTYGLEPPTRFREIDLLQTVRQRFKFPSNKLDYVAQQLGLGSKTQHKGMELWKDCMEGCPKAWKVMERYNKQDVNLLQKLYVKLLPWINAHPNMGAYIKDAGKPVCRKCGSTSLMKKGIEHTNTHSYQRYSCNSCKTPLRARLPLETIGKHLTV